ncbi:MAG: hypothetical protein QW356_05215 [Candidatus Hadarchaeales archaeon]
MNREGVEAFRKYLVDLRSGSAPTTDISDLLSSPYSDQFEPQVEVDDAGGFKNKLEMAKHLKTAFEQSGVDWRSVMERAGIWDWLSVLWFDGLTRGGSKILDPSHYILDEGRYRYRHLIRSAFFTYCYHGEEMGLLYMPLDEWGELWEQIAGRGYLFKSRTVMSIINQLCWENKSRPRKRAAGLVREKIWRLLNQFMRTYDVGGMDPLHILRLTGLNNLLGSGGDTQAGCMATESK